jgi:hypothetical protein
MSEKTSKNEDLAAKSTAALLPIALQIVADELVKSPHGVKPEFVIEFINMLTAAHARLDLQEAEEICLPVQKEFLETVGKGDPNAIRQYFVGMLMDDGLSMIKVQGDLFVVQDFVDSLQFNGAGEIQPKSIEFLRKMGLARTENEILGKPRNYRFSEAYKKSDINYVVQLTPLGNALIEFLGGANFVNTLSAARSEIIANVRSKLIAEFS